MEIPLALPPLLGISDVEQTLAPMLPTVIAAGQQFFPEACMLVEQVSCLPALCVDDDGVRGGFHGPSCWGFLSSSLCRGRWSGSEHPIVCEGIVTLAAQDDVIEHLNSDDLASIHQSICDAYVLQRGFRISGRVIVGKHDGTGILTDCLTKDFPRMNEALVGNPPCDTDPSEQAMLVVEQQDPKVLLSCIPVRLEPAADVSGAPEALANGLDGIVVSCLEVLNEDLKDGFSPIHS